MALFSSKMCLTLCQFQTHRYVLTITTWCRHTKCCSKCHMIELNSNMRMFQHVLCVCQNCYFQIRLIRRLGKTLSVESKLLLVHALVHSRLDYCNSVLARLPWSLVQQLQSLLNSAACLIFSLKRSDHITPALMDLHWLPYPQRITYKLCMIMFKCLRGSAPAYLTDYCTSTYLMPG